MLRKVGGYLISKPSAAAPSASQQLEQEGFVLLQGLLGAEEIDLLRSEITEIFTNLPPDGRSKERSDEDDLMFRYEMLNRSAACQRMIAHSAILEVIEPLLGEDCHVIANTAWRNPAGHSGGHKGQAWHIDAGPHVPLPPGTQWPVDIPHPVFAIGCHVYLQDCNEADGPTGVIPGSHLSGRPPPRDQLFDETLSYEGQSAIPLIAKAGDVGLFVSDVWHRRMPTQNNDQGRFFLQIHYGRRDIAQRIRTTHDAHQLSPEALARMNDDRDKTIAGIHTARFYDG